MVRWDPGSFPFPRALVRPWRRVHPRIHKGDGRERGGRDSDLGHRDGAGVDAEPRIRFDERRGDVERGKLRRYVLRSAIRVSRITIPSRIWSRPSVTDAA